MDNVNSSSNTMDQTTELYVKKVLPGNMKTVRLQVLDAMETLGYDIIEEEPNIIGRRGAKDWGTWVASANALDYATTLVVRLKSIGETSTRVTFDYLIKHGMLNKGDQNLIVQEAKTIAAISKTHTIEKLCSVCETESTDDSKFCRRCGAPLTSEHAELEVLRMMAETRAGKTSIVVSSILTPIASILIFVAVILNSAGLIKPKLFPILLVFGGAGLLISMIASFFGWNRFKRALEKPETERQSIPRNSPTESTETGEFEELPPSQPVASITEGTTNLLDEEWVKTPAKEKIPVRKKRETNEL